VEPALSQLVSSLLYEGYALYPYTPGATKNATPTPFGIVYPPAYAEHNPSTFDHLRIECVLEAGPGARVGGTALFLQAAGERHRGVERRLAVPPTSIAQLAADGAGEEFGFDGDPPLRGRFRLRATMLPEPELVRVTMCVHNTTEIAGDARTMDRGEALRASLLSTHVVLEADGGRFVSPLERQGTGGAAVAACSNVNTFPVLATPDDDAVLGAAIVLPDHPKMAPESLGNLFDNTEIEEALLLHVKALSEGERDEIAGQDPVVRDMVERADTAGPEEIMALHGRLELSDPEPGHPNPGESEVTVDGVTFCKGEKVLLRPGTERDVYDRMLDGRTATVERIYLDYDGQTHLGVTVDNDPAQELFRETGRYLFFKAHELESPS
jgi:hypothetical protein